MDLQMMKMIYNKEFLPDFHQEVPMKLMIYSKELSLEI